MRIVIVGGVAGGMSCAARARRLDESAEIIVFERGPYVSFANCGLPYFVGGEITNAAALQVQTPQSLKTALNLDVRVNHEVTAVDVAAQQVTVHTPAGVTQLSYDALVLAPGAATSEPFPDALSSARVHTLRTIDDAREIVDTITASDFPPDAGVVVIGAGFIGLEAAEALGKRGFRPQLLEFGPHALPPLETELAALLQRPLAECGVQLRTGAAAERIESGPDYDELYLRGVKAPIRARLILLSAGVRPDTEVFAAAGVQCDAGGAILVDAHGRTSVPHIWAVGDATASTHGVTGIKRPVALAGPANRAGRLVADDILHPEWARAIPQPIGTAIVRVGDTTVALTGANRAALADAGLEYRTIHLHPNQHAGYYPGATPIHLIVHFAPDGRLLGAQALGGDGVDKRIDVLATAIKAHLHVSDLIDLDLAYSPPYGQAKDPVNLAGMIGENVQSGLLRLCYTEAIEQWSTTSLVIDVRRRDEYATGHVRGAINIPHTQLRDRLAEVKIAAAGRPVVVYCAVGFRANLAYHILRHAGFNVSSVSGGMLTMRAALTHAQADQFLVTGPNPEEI